MFRQPKVLMQKKRNKYVSPVNFLEASIFLTKHTITFLPSLEAYKNMCALFVFTALFPLLSANCLSTESPISTECAVFTALNKILNLDFSSPAWNLLDWQVYIVQDFKYMYDYPSVVVTTLQSLCYTVLTDDVLDQVVRKLTYTVNPIEYEARYGVHDVLIAPRSQVLEIYERLYLRQTDCYDLLSAVLPCICIYGPIARALDEKYTDIPIHTSARTWIDHNKKGTGSSCAMIKEMLSGNLLKNEPYDEAMKLEMEFFALNRESEGVKTTIL